MGVTAALAVFGSVLVASPASAVDDRISVEYWVDGPDSATVCVNLNGGDSLAYFPDTSTSDPDDTTTTDVETALTIDDANTGDLSEATIEYVDSDTDCGDWEFYVYDIYVGDWNEINFRFDAWITDGDNDVWAEGSTANHNYVQTHEGNPDWTYNVWTTWVNENSYSDVGLAHNNDYIQDERHSAYYCLDNDSEWSGWVDDYSDDNNDYAYMWEDIVGDPIVYVYDLTAGEFVGDNTGNEDWDVTITDVEDEGYDYQHCESSDREFWIEGLELGHTYEFQSQFEVETYMSWDDGNSNWWAQDWVYSIGFDRSVNFTPLDIRQNLVGTLPSDNDGHDGEYNWWSDSEDLFGWSGWWTNWFQTGDSVEYEDTQYTNVDIILPQMQGVLSGDYANNDSIGGEDLGDKWYVSDDWSGNAWWAYFESDANIALYDGNDWGWDWQWSNICDVNGADVNDYEPQFYDPVYDEDSGAGVCGWDYGNDWYYNRGNVDYYDDGRWGHLANFEGQAFVEVANWQNDSNDDINSYQDEDDVLEGLSNSYSSTWDWGMQNDYVRATGSDSIQLSLDTDAGDDWICNSNEVTDAVNVEDSNATFHIRLLPNYGQDAYYDDEDGGYQNGSSENGMDNYSGNESYPESRLYAVDYTFEPGDYAYDGFNWCSDEKAPVVFDLTTYDQDDDGTLEPWETLEPGTTYSVQIMATFDRIWDDEEIDQYGDGGYDVVNFSKYVNSYATTYLESHVDVVSETSAKFEVNLQDSHYTDRFNLDSAGYLAWTECTDEVEWTDCHQYVGGLETAQSFNIGDINRVLVASDASIEFIDGDKHIVFTRNDLNADTSYSVVFGLDYWQTVNSIDDANQTSLRKEMEDTLDGSNCDNDGFSPVYDEVFNWYEANGTDCYNSTTANDLYRTDVATFRTFGAPELDSVTTVDNDASQDGTDTNSSITLEFSKNVVAGSGLIQIVRASDDKVFQTIRPSASQNVAIDGNVVTITPGKNFAYGTGYYVYVGEGAFVDEDGVAFAGNDNNVTTFSTEEKPEEIGTVSVSLDGNFKRTVSVDLKKSAAFETVQVWWHDNHSLKLMYAGSITLDENGNGDFTRVLPRLNKLDNVIVTLGRHTVASQVVATS